MYMPPLAATPAFEPGIQLGPPPTDWMTPLAPTLYRQPVDVPLMVGSVASARRMTDPPPQDMVAREKTPLTEIFPKILTTPPASAFAAQEEDPVKAQPLSKFVTPLKVVERCGSVETPDTAKVVLAKVR